MANKFLGKLEQAKDLKIELEQSGMFFNLQKNGKEGCYYVLAQDKNQSEDSIVDTPGIPVLGTVLNGAPVKGFSAREVATVRHWQTGVITILWEVEVSTDSKLTADNTNTSGDPTEMRPRRRWYTEKEEVSPEKDRDGELIQTATGERLIVEFPEVINVLEITRYEEAPFDPLKQFHYCNKSNLETFYGAPSGCALMDDIQSDEEEVNGQTYCKVTYVVKFKIRDAVPPVGSTTTTTDPNQINLEEDTYSHVKLLHRGYQFFPTVEAASDKKPQIYKVDGQPTEVNIDAQGLITTIPFFVPYLKHKKKDWSPLGLEF